VVDKENNGVAKKGRAEAQENRLTTGAEAPWLAAG
jgi:hypothetical protein